MEIFIKTDSIKNLTLPEVRCVSGVFEVMASRVESGVYEGYIT